MRRWLAYPAALTLAFSLPQCAGAGVVINEFLYDADGSDTDKEYVEILNTGSSDVDLTKYKINDGSNHVLNAPPKNGGTGSLVIPAGSYALLVNNAANFIAAHPTVSGTVIDTVLSLSNAGGTISLIDDKSATIDSVTYTKDQRGNGDGNSLQRNGANWIPALPTPLSTNATQAAAPKPPVVKTTATVAKTAATPKKAATSHAASASVVDPVEDPIAAESVAPALAEVAAAGSVDTHDYLWWLGAFGIAIAACGAVYAVKRAQKSEWNIIDESA